MRNRKQGLLALIAALATLVMLVAYRSEDSILPGLRVSADQKTSLFQTPKTPSPKYSRTTEHVEHSGYSKFVYRKTGSKNAAEGSVLITSSIANEKSFGGGRSFKDFVEAIDSLEYPKDLVSLSFYCGSQDLLTIVTDFFEAATTNPAFSYAQVTILHAPFLQSEFTVSDHTHAVQRHRRRNIARGRNFVVLNSLEAEEFTLFLDADVVSFDHTDMLRRFVLSKKDIIVPRVAQGGQPDYDKNTWRGRRTTPSDMQLKLMDEDKWEEADYTPKEVRGESFHLINHAVEVQDLPESDPKRDPNFSVPLDSVGGAVLFAKSIIYKQGVVFPTMNVIGTTWNRKEGFDGIETEGLCYLARSIGYECHAMPNLVAQHFDS